MIRMHGSFETRLLERQIEISFGKFNSSMCFGQVTSGISSRKILLKSANIDKNI
jgi:hypothetical protein